ncbi:NADH-quinone oxidoreductase subunit G [Lachnospiraceae bacterium KH1T2]|nr:NADH-quinone oxidoreductase subunit G [Lachnospiraceae bacterium KH1T2]
MVNLRINDRNVSVPEGTTILNAARACGIHIPHLCYLRDINEIGACRLCCVDVEGEEKLVPACNNRVREGMVINTNSPRARASRKMNLQLILSEHDCKCATCSRSGNCQLQSLANDYGIIDNPYGEHLLPKKFTEWDSTFPLIRDANKCIKCMRCIQICDKVQKMNIWDLEATGSRTRVNVSDNISITESDCTLCGQCITHCPVGALRERNDIDKVMKAIEDPNIVTAVQIAPAVRTAVAEELGINFEKATVNKIAAVLKTVGIDYVFDTSYAADLTIMEEGTEFLKRLNDGELSKYPMFTSCCPGWVSFVKSQYPELAGQLSTAKSPQQMFGAVLKTYFAKKHNLKPSEIFSISIMPCVSKKKECARPEMRREDGAPDVDVVLTTRELLRLIRSERISPRRVEGVAFDEILDDYTGAGVIFGTTGGVMEAALRTASYIVTGKNPEPDAFQEVRRNPNEKDVPWRAKTFNIAGTKLNIAVTSGLGNARKLCDAILSGEVKFDFVEVMACPGGCAGGGGQPIHCDDIERADERGRILYDIDRDMPLRFSHENLAVKKLYDEELEKPLSEKAEKLLHV